MNADINNLSTLRWLVTGGAGFIGLHLVEALLSQGQEVVVLDNHVTGSRVTLKRLGAGLDPNSPARLEMIEGDIRDISVCRAAVQGCHHVLHHAALGSVPASVADPATTHAVNEGGFLNILLAARDAGVKSVVFASSSAVYGDDSADVKREGQTGRVLSPYAAGKRANELQAEAFSACFGLPTVGLRYFNVYGPRQDPAGPYAAVIPVWLTTLVQGRKLKINGDGSTSRDFCFVADVVQANLRAALCGAPVGAQVFNIGSGQRTTLNDLLAALQHGLRAVGLPGTSQITHGPFRAGDILHSLAEITRAKEALGFAPAYDLKAGLAYTIGAWCSKTSGMRTAVQKSATVLAG